MYTTTTNYTCAYLSIIDVVLKVALLYVALLLHCFVLLEVFTRCYLMQSCILQPQLSDQLPMSFHYSTFYSAGKSAIFQLYSSWRNETSNYVANVVVVSNSSYISPDHEAIQLAMQLYMQLIYPAYGFTLTMWLSATCYPHQPRIYSDSIITSFSLLYYTLMKE